MAKRLNKKNTIQVFIVSWFPIYAKEAATILCLSQEHAKRVVGELTQSFAGWPSHDPLIQVDRQERRTTC